VTNKIFVAVAISIAAALTRSVFAADVLVPGIYHLDADSYLSAPKKARPPAGEEYVERFEHAIPESANAAYAVVSHDPDSNLNKLTFLVNEDYQTDPNTANKLCIAYAFPDWNDYSPSDPFCRTNIGSSDYEAALSWSKTSFTVNWQPRKKFLGVEHVQPERLPTPDETGACALGVCDERAFGRVVSRYEVSYASDRFTLETRQAYRDILYLKRAVPVFSLADRNSAHSDIGAGKFVAVLSVSPQWYEVDQFSQDGNRLRGWINRDDVFDVKWVAQKAETTDFSFRVAFRPGEDESVAALPVAIEVIDRKNKRRAQIIRDFYSDIPFAANDQVLQLIDANFDGYPDISIFGQSWGAGPNSTENFFLFDPASRQFVFDQELSALTQISIDPSTRTITSAQRNSCCSHSSETYRYKGNKLVLIADWDESLSADGKWIETTTGRMQKGKLHHVTTRKKADLR